MKTRLIALFILLVLLLGALTPAVFATERDEGYPYAGSKEEYAAQCAAFLKAEQDVIKELREGTHTYSVDISKYKISTEIDSFIEDSPYFVQGKISINCWRSAESGYYTTIAVNNKMPLEELLTYFDRVDAEIAEIDALLETASTEVDKALVLHDYLAYNNEYDYANLQAGTLPAASYSTGGLFLNHRGVCEAYSRAFSYFMNREGIECHLVSSYPMSHMWNIVKIGGAFYHVDVTWDDPVPDNLGRVYHSHFLVSDSAIQTSRGGFSDAHHDWTTQGIQCSSTTYDNAYWYGVNSRIYLSGNDRYYCADGNVVRRDVTSGKIYPLARLGQWPVWGSGSRYWVGSYSGLYLKGSKLYYNNARALCCVDIHTGANQTLYSANTSNGYVFGSAVRDGVMYYDVKQKPNGDVLARYSVSFAQLSKVAEEGPLFTDVLLGSWYYDAVEYAVSNKLMNGVGGSRFAPNDPMTRAMLVTVLWRFEGEPNEGTNAFVDVPDGQWYTQAVAWAAANGIVGGVGNNKFDPNGNITREQMAAILFRYANTKGFDTSKRGDLSKFPDASKVSDWAKDAIAWAVGEGIIGGSDGKLLPQGNATRAQVSTILMRFIEKFA